MEPTDADALPKDTNNRQLFFIKIAVSGQDMALEVFLVGVPEFGGLGVQRARAVPFISLCGSWPCQRLLYAYLLGSPKRL